LCENKKINGIGTDICLNALKTATKNAKKHVNLMFNYKKNYKIFEDEVILKI
jgi:methylase of polypeptide subunit release factors